MSTIAAVLLQKGPDVICVAPFATLPEIAEIIAARRIGAVVVLDPDRTLIGIVSERDVVRAIAEHGAAAMKRTAEDLMTRKVVTASPETTVERAMEMMDAGYFRHLPVVQAGELVGIVSIRDLARHRALEQATEAERLRAGLPPARG
jgi:CBS domain-containing protein